MDRRTVLAIALCFGVFLAWQKLYIEPRMPKPQPVATQQTAPAAEAPTSSLPNTTMSAATPEAKEKRPSETRELSTKVGKASIGDGNKFFVGWDLASYRLGIADKAAAVDLKSVTNESGAVEILFDDPMYAYLANVQGTFSSTPEGTLWTHEDENVKLTRLFKADNQQSFVNTTLNAEFKTKRPNFAFVSVATHSVEGDPEQADRQLIYFTKNALERVNVDSAPDVDQVVTPVKYVGATNRYFVLAVLNNSPLESKGLIQPLGERGGRASLVYPVTGNTISIPVRVYFGPKELDTLRSADLTLDHAIDLGWFTVVAYPLLKGLKWLYALVHNYGIAIILLTIFVKIITFPLTYKSMKSMKKMSVIQPQIAALRDRHKNDKEALNREMLSLMRTNGYNPMAGCFPILIQMPVFIALYRVLYSSIELYHAPFALWIQDLSARDPYYVTPVLLTLTMFLQQKLTPNTATDPMQARMLQFMPVIFGAMMITLPSGLTLYMLVNAIVSIVQQIFLNKKLGINPQPMAVGAK